MNYVKKSLPDDGQSTHEGIGVNGGGLFLADRIEGHDLSHFFFQNQIVRVSIAQENAGTGSSENAFGGRQVGDRETMFAQGFPFALIRLKTIDSLPLGVNPGDFEPRSFFPGIRPCRGGAVKGQISRGMNVMVVL